MRIAVLLGGTSAERDVSLVTGEAVGRALEDVGHEVSLVDPAVGPEPLDRAARATIGTAPPEIGVETGAAVRAVSGRAVREADVVFIALHGGTGEDGTIQGLLELAGKRYTGSGVRASALAMDKHVSKLIFRDAGVPTPDWRAVRDGSELDAAAKGLGCAYPMVVKPNDQGSTVGLSVVKDADELRPAFELARRYSEIALIERFVEGREMTVAVLDGRPLPVVEIAPESGFYDYASKYQKGATVYTCPAQAAPALEAALGKAALDAFDSLGCRAYGRVDFRVTPGGEPFCLEANTVPGMTETSLVPMAARAAGMDFGQLVDAIANLALK
jgi:D-alanine-D-alanine ligase